ncbi:hypothetical protein BM221_000424 [Beauveria bassiana]|uniref:BRCT domain-containing protein n=1 Tax=Beauveria bassiana TaxID=176275 RepID=A0A2N6P0G3_BEABA|nr:hypothetical protein BM221_000424 [Beauveria bassiana]
MPRQIFKNRVLATAGPLPPTITLDNLRTWIPLRKGRFAEAFDDEVTHLLCTHEQFKKRVPLVKKVLKDYKRIHIVHYDWLEFSAVANKRLPEREYSMRHILAKERAEKRERNRQENGRREGERGVNPTLFHIYQDRDFFPYQIDLTRNSSDDGEFGQRYTLTLWESNAKPHLYWFTAKFIRRKGDPNASYHRPSPCSGKWRHEMDLLLDFFRIKTGIDWQDRVLLAGTTPLSAFQYTPPTGGKPVGRRLRFSYDCCVELNLEWKQQNLPQEIVHKKDSGEAEEAVEMAEDYDRESVGHDADDSDIASNLGKDNCENKTSAARPTRGSNCSKKEPLGPKDSGIWLQEDSAETADDEPGASPMETGS